MSINIFIHNELEILLTEEKNLSFKISAKKCPYNMQYQECSSPCADTCTNLERSQFCEEHCMDGCFCPPGKFICTHNSDLKEQQQLTCRIWAGSMGFKPPVFGFFTPASNKHLSCFSWEKISESIANICAIFRKQESRTANRSKALSEQDTCATVSP